MTTTHLTNKMKKKEKLKPPHALRFFPAKIENTRNKIFYVSHQVMDHWNTRPTEQRLSGNSAVMKRKRLLYTQEYRTETGRTT